MPRTPAEASRHAIELMNAWLDAPDGPADAFIDCLRGKLEEYPHQDQLATAVALIMGMTQLSGGLLILLEEATGLSARDTLQEFAGLYAT